jgi:tight adherence protein C
MSTGLLLGCALGAALCLLLYAIAPPRTALGTAVSRWERQHPSQPGGSQRHWSSSVDITDRVRGARWLHRQAAAATMRLADHGIGLGRLRADLEITDTSLEAHLVRKVGYGVVGILAPAVVTACLLAIGASPPVTVPLLGGLILGGLLFWVPDRVAAAAAQRRRSELRRALSCYLDLVAMSLAGGRGIPEALPTAARIGHGWAFELLRSTLDHARLVGDTPWTGFAQLGARIDMPELQDLGGALQLVAEDGAKVRASLTARASTQRRRQLAEAEGAAAKADQTIQLAQVVLAVGFFLFLGYPAVVAVLGL